MKEAFEICLEIIANLMQEVSSSLEANPNHMLADINRIDILTTAMKRILEKQDEVNKLEDYTGES